MEIMSASFWRGDADGINRYLNFGSVDVLSHTGLCHYSLCNLSWSLQSLYQEVTPQIRLFFSYFKMIYKLENSLVTAGKNEQHITKEL